MPFWDQTINFRLRREIYYGEWDWEVNSTEVMVDRVVERNPEDHFVCVPDFCEPLVSREDR
jgi:hypothetical protein